MKEHSKFSHEDDSENDDNNGNSNSNDSLFMYKRTEQPNGQVQGGQQKPDEDKRKAQDGTEANTASKVSPRSKLKRRTRQGLYI